MSFYIYCPKCGEGVLKPYCDEELRIYDVQDIITHAVTDEEYPCPSCGHVPIIDKETWIFTLSELIEKALGIQ